MLNPTERTDSHAGRELAKDACGWIGDSAFRGIAKILFCRLIRSPQLKRQILGVGRNLVGPVNPLICGAVGQCVLVVLFLPGWLVDKRHLGIRFVNGHISGNSIVLEVPDLIIRQTGNRRQSRVINPRIVFTGIHRRRR